MRPSIRITFALAFMWGAASAGCASAPAPTERMAASESSIRAAEELGAPGIPAAALHLQLAKEQLEHAKLLMKEGENDRARALLLRAEADAELAVAEAREKRIGDQAQQSLLEAQALEQRANSL